MRRRTLPLLLSALIIAGLLPSVAQAIGPDCDRAPQARPCRDAVDPDPDVDPADSRVVVAPIDSGINPYHEAFQVERSSVTPAVLAEFGITSDRVLHISDSYEDDVAAGVYDDVQLRTAYHFAGTNIIVWSDNFGSRPFLPNSESNTHGTGVSGSIAAASPEAVIYFIEGISDAAETEAFTNPAVDMVTTSYGFITALPLGNITASYEGVVDNGKLHFGANPNDPSPSVLDSTGGPWWAISISGFEEGTSNGKAFLSGSAPEFVADFTQDLPYCATCTEETRMVSGTSFATPTSAGLTSAALLQLRRDAGHVGGITDVDGTAYMIAAGDTLLTNWELRRALEEAAAIPTVEEYDPVEAVFDLGTYPNLPAGGYTLYGWGLLTADPARDTVQGVVDVIATGETRKSADTCSYMTALFEAREAFWTANATSDGFLGSADDYIAC